MLGATVGNLFPIVGGREVRTGLEGIVDGEVREKESVQSDCWIWG